MLQSIAATLGGPRPIEPKLVDELNRRKYTDGLVDEYWRGLGSRPAPARTRRRDGAGAVNEVRIGVNGTPRELVVPAHELLLDTLRERLGLTGAKRSCDVQVCGTCTVLVDGQPVSSCTYLACDADGREVLTIEGFAEQAEFAEFERAFDERAALQCGFCTPGFVLTLKALRDAGELRSREDVIRGLDGNVCRCTGYKSIVEAAEMLVGEPAAPRGER